MASRRRYPVSDGRLVLAFEDAGEGRYVVPSPLDPELITEAEPVAETLENARDAAYALRWSRARLRRRFAGAAV